MLELEKVCLRCEGHGIVGEGDVCPECDGTGQVLTEDGKEVASLVHRFLREAGQDSFHRETRREARMMEAVDDQKCQFQAQINRIDEDLAELRNSRVSK